jgi:hypothetical protein
MQLSEAVIASVAESLVIKGDISQLNPAQRIAFYRAMCEQLGLNPASHPLQVLRLNGKEILYPTRGATDQLAAIHKLNREIVDGPKIMDLGGTKLVYAMCRATLPNGRSETAVATLPLADPANVLMKCETKAKRRATLSILGLNMLDESELDTIPASAKEEVPHWVDVKQVDPDDFDPEREAIANDGPTLTQRILSCGTLEGLSELSNEARALKKGSPERAEAAAAIKTRRAQIEDAATGAAGG